MSRISRMLVGLLAAGLVCAPMLGATAAPVKKKAPAKKAPAKKAPAKKAPVKTASAKGDATAGKEAFKSEGCAGCHKSKDFTDGSLGPDLSASTKTVAQIEAYARHPKAGSQMPAYKGPQKTLDNIAAYLTKK
jgi:heparin binding hemagglutinin HbhA